MKQGLKRTAAGVALSVASLTACGTPGNNIEACPTGWTGPEVSEPWKVQGVLSAIGQMAISESGKVSDTTDSAFTDSVDSVFGYRNNADELNELFCVIEEDANKVVVNPHGAALIQVALQDDKLQKLTGQLGDYLPYKTQDAK